MSTADPYRAPDRWSAQPSQQPMPQQPPGYGYNAPAYYQPAQSVRAFYFDGGAATYFGTGLLAFLITVLTLGLGIPWAICLRYSWRTKHTYVNGHRLRFNGTGAGLFGNWIKWFLLIIITLGIYSFWVVPRLTKWIVEHQEFDPGYRPQG